MDLPGPSHHAFWPTPGTAPVPLQPVMLSIVVNVPLLGVIGRVVHLKTITSICTQTSRLLLQHLRPQSHPSQDSDCHRASIREAIAHFWLRLQPPISILPKWQMPAHTGKRYSKYSLKIQVSHKSHLSTCRFQRDVPSERHAFKTGFITISYYFTKRLSGKTRRQKNMFQMKAKGKAIVKQR